MVNKLTVNFIAYYEFCSCLFLTIWSLPYYSRSNISNILLRCRLLNYLSQTSHLHFFLACMCIVFICCLHPMGSMIYLFTNLVVVVEKHYVCFNYLLFPQLYYFFFVYYYLRSFSVARINNLEMRWDIDETSIGVSIVGNSIYFLSIEHVQGIFCVNRTQNC